MTIPFHSKDLEIFQGDTVSLQISIVNANSVPVTPANMIGYFAFAASPNSTPLVSRNSANNPSDVYFTTSNSSPLWLLTCNLKNPDTANLAPALYFYEIQLANTTAQNTIKSGWFLVKPNII